MLCVLDNHNLVCHIRAKEFLGLNSNPCLMKGVVTTPLRIIFRPAKAFNFNIKRVQLSVESSFPVILAQKFLLPYPGVGVG